MEALNIPEAYPEILWKLKVGGQEELSRNGTVITIPHVFHLKIIDPCQRVLFDPERDANPFFHVMEFIWMMAGRDDVAWISQFNKGMAKYADGGSLLGAYGMRWRFTFKYDQILEVVDILRKNPETRRAVIAMWNPDIDLEESLDIPCNTHIYFRIIGRSLHMTVCNRSNDAVWGMMGSNCVHMTMLQELIALELGLYVGHYNVVTNNLHIYKEPHGHLLVSPPPVFNPYSFVVKPFPLLQKGEVIEEFLCDAENFCKDGTDFKCQWFYDVAWHMKLAYLDKKQRDGAIEHIVASDWRLACEEWAERRKREQDNNLRPGRNDRPR